MDNSGLDSNLIEMMVEETLGATPEFSVNLNEKSKAYEVKINQLYLEIPQNWTGLTEDQSGEIIFPKHLLEVLELEVGLGTLESISIVKAYNQSLQLDIQFSNLVDLKAA